MASNKDDDDGGYGRLYPIPIYDVDSEGEENYEGARSTPDRPHSQDQRGRGRGRSHGRGRLRGGDQRREAHSRSSSRHRDRNEDEKYNHDVRENSNNNLPNVENARGKGGNYRKPSRGNRDRGRGTGRVSGRGRGFGKHIHDSNADVTVAADSSDRQTALSSDSFKDVNDTNVSGTKRDIQPMQFHKLIHLSKQSDGPDRVLLEISNTKSGFKEFISGQIEAKCYFILFRLLNIAITSHQLQGIRQLLQLLEQILLPKLPEFLNDICMRSQETRYLWNKKSDLAILISNLISVLNKTMAALPSSISKCSVIILQLQQVQLNFFQDGAHPSVANDIEEARAMQTAMLEEKEKLRQEQEKMLAKPKRKKITDDDRLPPEDFRTLSILPTLVDLQMDEKPFLRANKAKGKYDSLDTYLDIQFRLLREDYISPLRNGISMYREYIKTKGNVSKLRDIRLYHDVQILRPICSSSGINHVIQFDISRFKRMNWAASKRLLHGSLLCLSNDDFDTAIYAIVTDRKEKELSEGMLQVHFENLPEWIQASDKLIMAESTTYFEAYRHILLGLQETKTLPLDRYILECQTLVMPPDYLLYQSDLTYSFKPLMSRRDDGLFPVLDLDGWPSKSSLQLDISQYEALKCAITKELAIIQGPPGTGKTYVGLKIAKLLIENKKVWQRTKQDSRPSSHAILVVCYTNHALDQFLEGIQEFSKDGIVRIGGRCNSEILEEYILKNIKLKNRQDRSRPRGIHQSEIDCRNELWECQRLITEVSSKLKKSRIEIVSLDKLSHFMTADQVSAFSSKVKEGQDKQKCLYEWLGLTFRESDSLALNIDENERVKRLWETFIIEKAEKFPRHASDIQAVWELDLYDRARLYKTWIHEFIGNIELKLQDIRRRGNVQSLQAAEDILEKLIQYTETEIVGVSTLLKYIENPIYHLQIQQLTNKNVPIERAINVWLYLHKTNESTNAIKVTLEKMHNVEESGNDLEEERGLEEDNTIGYCEEDEDERHVSTQDDDNWIMNWEKKKTKQEVTAMLKKAKTLSKGEVELLSDVWNQPLSVKRNLYCYWLEEYQNYLRQHVKQQEKQFNAATLRLEEVREQETLGILKSANFIGMTTTGAAKYRKLLQQVAPRIIIVEEAAEVLESHVITTLHDECKHLILIGDHKQLRPSTTVYELSKKYNLDISLFERLVNNGVSCVSLTEQHRMRPSISVLLRHPNLYPNLRDHPVVQTYEDVKGLDVNIQFISHEKSEETNAESTSYHNTFEAKFLARFCSHLLKQGYTPDQITVLSPYMGQVLTIRIEMPKPEFDGVRITAVDNFQGEENDIILLSLVRSSKPGSSDKRNPIGFLGIENRVCVALSRAKIGLFVFGNFTLLRNSSEIWDFMVKSVGKVSPSIKLICQNHPQNVAEVVDPADFEKVPDGGCTEPCGSRLNCGHICERYCHITDKEHKFIKCFKPCPKSCEFGHRCRKKCYEDCKKCETLVEKQIPLCGHTASIPCHQDPASRRCKRICTQILTCGHECKQACYKCMKESHTLLCKQKCEKTLRCGHTMEVECHRGLYVECTVQCDTTLDCGHQCIGICGICLNGKIHSGCNGSCTKTLPCGHKCTFPCSEICPPCSRKCEHRCSHLVRCKKMCSVACSPCMEDCSFKCKHKLCDKSCFERCDDIRCDEPCTLGIQNRDKDCKHKCSGLCGEKCPKICVKCNQDKVNDKDYLFAEGDRFIELPDCGHIIEVKRLDEIMLKPLNPRGEAVRRCPKGKCKRVIRTEIRRYAQELKDARKTALDRFNQLSGTEKERIQKAGLLKTEIDRLRFVGSGLDDKDLTILKKQLNHTKFGNLIIASRKVEHLKTVLEIRKNLTSFAVCSRLKQNLAICSNGIEDAKIVQAVLIRDKQYATKQYWREIGLEIKRLYNILYLMELQETEYCSGFSDSVLETYYKKSMTILTDGKPFDRTRDELIDKVKDRLTNKTSVLEKSNDFDQSTMKPFPKNERAIQKSIEVKEDTRAKKKDPVENPANAFDEEANVGDTFTMYEYSNSSDYINKDNLAEIEMGSDAIFDETSESDLPESKIPTRSINKQQRLYSSQDDTVANPITRKKPLNIHISQDEGTGQREQTSVMNQAFDNNMFEKGSTFKLIPRPRLSLRTLPDENMTVETDGVDDALTSDKSGDTVPMISGLQVKQVSRRLLANDALEDGSVRPKTKQTEIRSGDNSQISVTGSVDDRIAHLQTRTTKQSKGDATDTKDTNTLRTVKQIRVDKNEISRHHDWNESSSGIDLKATCETDVDFAFFANRKTSEHFKDLVHVAKQACGKSQQETKPIDIDAVGRAYGVKGQTNEQFKELVDIAKQTYGHPKQEMKTRDAGGVTGDYGVKLQTNDDLNKLKFFSGSRSKTEENL